MDRLIVDGVPGEFRLEPDGYWRRYVDGKRANTVPVDSINGKILTALLASRSKTDHLTSPEGRN